MGDGAAASALALTTEDSSSGSGGRRDSRADNASAEIWGSGGADSSLGAGARLREPPLSLLLERLISRTVF